MSPDVIAKRYKGIPDRVFVTGGAGFIGSHVVRRLVAAGKDVTCLVLPHDEAPALKGVTYTRVDGDLSNPSHLARNMEGCELVIHLAAIYALWLKRPERMYEVNVEGTRHILQAARQAGVRRVVHTSSIAAVGVCPGEEIADETALYSDWANPDPYVFSKYISEIEALLGNTDRLEVVSVNPAFPFGEDDRAPTPTGRLILNAMSGKLPFYMEGGFNAVYVGDVADGHLMAALQGRPGERYLLSGHNTSYADFAVLLSSIIGGRGPNFAIPTGLAKRFGQASEFVAEHITGRAPMATGRSVAYTAGRYLYFSNAKAQAELDYQPTPLEKAMRASVGWFRDHTHLF